MCRQYLDTAYAKQVLETLDSPKDDFTEIQELVADVLKKCKTEILSHMKYNNLSSLNIPSNTTRDEYWDKIPIELQLTVPCDWNGHPCGIMRNAAFMAGFEDVKLRSEPLCAAVLYIYEYVETGKVKVSILWNALLTRQLCG